MAAKNAYFHLVRRAEGTYLKLIPEADGGSPLDCREVAGYLSGRRVSYDMSALKRAVENLKKEEELLLNGETGPDADEALTVIADSGRMSATARFYAPSPGGRRMTGSEIQRELDKNGVRYGILVDVLQDFLEKPKYCTDYTIAEGTLPVQGKDASIQYLFDTNLSVKPAQNEDGTVDFHQLNIICPCREGDALARLTKAVDGTPGRNVYGETLPARDVTHLKLKFGRNVRLSEDQCEIFSEVAGHVLLLDETVFVSPVYEAEDVDTSTGNIEFSGSVQVRGNVRAGFQVRAGGNIEVMGVVEGADLEAAGHITIARGINGMMQGKLKAGGNIIVKFIENATAQAGGYIQTESILHSHVSATDEIIVDGRRGFITGGSVRAGRLVTAKSIGSPMGTDTVVEVGITPEMRGHHKELFQKILETLKQIEDLERLAMALMAKQKRGEILAPREISAVKALSQKKEEVQSDKAELLRMEEELDADTDARIKVLDTAYSGTRIIISQASMTVRETQRHCEFVKKDGVVQITIF